MLRYPDVSSGEIVFRYAGDLWITPKEGGTARRITSAQGAESFPRFSPDGARIAFAASYDGGTDLYVMDVGGGVPQRVTHHPGQEVLCDWYPDGESLLYWSSEAAGLSRAARLMKVSASGGQPEALPVPYGAFGSLDASAEKLVYTPSTREFRTWKRYRGGLAQDLWMFDLRTLASRQLTDYPGTDAQPMWNGDSLVFTSDRGANGILNLWSLDPESGATEQLTFFNEFGIRFPSIGPDDVVFENGGKLYRFGLASGKTTPVEVRIPGDRPNLRTRTHDLEDAAGNASPSPTAKRVAIEARGELFNVPVSEGITRNLTRTSGVAERDPAWSPDGRMLAYFSDRSGEYQLVLRRMDGQELEGADENGEKTVTQLGPGYRYKPVWSPDSKKVCFGANDGGVWVCRIEEDTYDRIAVCPTGEMNVLPAWSPTSDWLAWSHQHTESDLDAIQLYSLESGFTHQVTSGMFDDTEPVFGPAGDFLYFHSSREFRQLNADLDTTWIYANTRALVAVPLRDDVKNPFAPKDDAEDFEDEEDEEDAEADADADADAEEGTEEEDADEDAEDDEATEEEEPKLTEIDIDGFEGRAMLLPVPTGSLGNLGATANGLLFVRSPRTGSRGDSPQLMLFNITGDDQEEELVLDNCRSYIVCGDGEHVLAAVGGKWGVITAAPGQSIDEPVDFSGLTAEIEPRAEWGQMMDETWRLFRDYFYDEGMHGLDWPAVRERYMAALPDVNSREDLHFLTGEMMAELNVGHAYNRTPPEPFFEAESGPRAGLLGADISATEGVFRIDKILGGGSFDLDARSPLAVHGVDVAESEYLLAVNGIPVDTARSVHAHLLGTAGKATELTVNMAPRMDGNERSVMVEPIGSDGELRMRDWIQANRERVHEMSGGRVGYVYVPDTGQRGQTELMRQFMGEQHREALLIDERWNGGGQIPTRFIELLNRPLTNYWAIRHGEDWNWPPRGQRGPKAMLINGWAGSGGDAFPFYFRQAGLGKLIGMRTWGGLVGISGNPPLVDGTAHAIPRFAFYELDGTWGIEGHGVAPDIEVVDNPTSLARGRDEQLEAGVSHLLTELEGYERPLKRRPAGPDRSGSGIPTADH